MKIKNEVMKSDTLLMLLLCNAQHAGFALGKLADYKSYPQQRFWLFSGGCMPKSAHAVYSHCHWNATLNCLV